LKVQREHPRWGKRLKEEVEDRYQQGIIFQSGGTPFQVKDLDERMTSMLTRMFSPDRFTDG
jgi:hypothetical protein